MKSKAFWVCTYTREEAGEEIDPCPSTKVEADYEQISYSGIPICLECGQDMEFDHEEFMDE